MKWILISLCLYSLTISAAPQNSDPVGLDRAYQLIATEYPNYRNYWGAFSIASGLYCGAWGFISFFSADTSLATIMGFGLTFSALTTFFDGYRLLKGLSGPEVIQQRYERYAPGPAKAFGGVISREEYGRTHLQELADEAYTGRILRMSSYLLSAAGMLYFYGAGPYSGDKFLLAPGILMAGAGIYRLMQDSPEERGILESSGAQTSWRVLPSVSSVWLVGTF